MATVYLAGPITGLSYNGATDWRQEATARLADHNIFGVSPMRAKDYLQHEEDLQDNYEHLDDLASILSSSRGITARDRWDVSRCDAIIANFLGTEKVSIGTVMEIAWADAWRKPVIVVMEPDGNPHDHAMIRECTGFRVTSVDDAIRVASALLG